VLIDSLKGVIEVSSTFCRSISHEPVSTAEIIGTLEDMTYYGLARSIGLTTGQSEQYADYVFEKFQDTGSSMPFFPGIESMLHHLAPSDMAIVSGNARDVITAKLAAHHLAKAAPCILGAFEPGDKAEKIRNACRYFNADPASTCMIGDAVSDIRQAKKAGVQSIAVTWGWQSRELLAKNEPDYIVESVDELADLLI